VDFIYSQHAREQMRLRRVTEEEIIYVLQRFSLTYPAHHGGTSLIAYFPDRSQLKIWVANALPLHEPIFIKSVGRRKLNVND
jgi:hypothetical protein